MYKIDIQTLSKFRSLAYDNTEEQCCFLIHDEKTNNISLDESSCSKGYKEKYTVKDKNSRIIVKERGACTFEIKSDIQMFSPFIIHSHPLSSKPYPSYEDIKKVIYKFYIQASLISTKNGLWILSSKDSKVRRYIYNNLMNDKGKLDHKTFDKEYKNIIDFYLDKIYKLYVSTNRELLPTNETQLIVESLNKKLRTNIQFYSWRDIEGKIFYFDI